MLQIRYLRLNRPPLTSLCRCLFHTGCNRLSGFVGNLIAQIEILWDFSIKRGNVCPQQNAVRAGCLGAVAYLSRVLPGVNGCISKYDSAAVIKLKIICCCRFKPGHRDI